MVLAVPNCQNLDLMQAACRINFPGGGEWVGMAGLTENKANSANPAELELVFSWAELGNMMFQLVVWSMARNCISGCIINTVYSPGTIQSLRAGMKGS